jgi:ribonuclease HI
VLRFQGNHKTLQGYAAETTNNRMELTAVIEGLKALKRPCEVELFTDSKYVMQGLTEWLAKWKSNGWKTAAKKPVKNIDLWQQLEAEVAQHEIDWNWVKGHAGIADNELADQLANAAIDAKMQA